MGSFSLNLFAAVSAAVGLILGAAGMALFLRQKTAKLQKAGKAKSDFVVMASHQLRTPLSAIKWLLQPLLEESDNLTPEQRQKLRAVYQSNERLINLVGDLLSTTKLESGEVVAKREPADLGSLIEGAVKTLQPEAEMNKVRIRTRAEGDLKKIKLDPILFAEAFKNILDNSLGFAPAGSVVDITVSRRGGDYVIGVHNDGPAVTEEERVKLFAKFYRGPLAKSRRPEGSGLGLFFARAAMEALGGKVWFESPTNPDNTGATFYLGVPIV